MNSMSGSGKNSELAGGAKGETAFHEYLESYKRNLFGLISGREFPRRSDEPPAPWLCFHYPLQFDRKELDTRGVEYLIYAEKDSFFWHTLDGAPCMRAFLSHLQSIPFAERVAYFKRFDLGPRWTEREAWFQLAFDSEEVGEDEYEAAHAEVFRPPGE